MIVVEHGSNERCLPECGLGKFLDGRMSPPTVSVHTPVPTAAFSRRDRLRPGADRASEIARAAGFRPWRRAAGGRFTAYDSWSLVVEVIQPHSRRFTEPRRRFEVYTGALRDALSGFADDVRVGEVPGEFCPGEFSLNLGGRRKVVGVAQRSTKDAWLVSSVVNVTWSRDAALMIDDVYQELGYEWAPETFGSLADGGGVPCPAEVSRALVTRLLEAMG